MGNRISRTKRKSEESKVKNAPPSKVEDKGDVNSVLFFPDDKMPCRSIIHPDHPCKRGLKCTFSHEETSLVKFLRLLQRAKKTMDICVYTITCDEIAHEVIAAHKRGVEVRVITDDGQRGSRGSDVDRIKKEGVAVRDDGNPANYMHHKFAVIDSHTLLNGSFNWTRHAVLGNYENVVISTDPKLCVKFREEFDRLWGDFRTKTYV